MQTLATDILHSPPQTHS